MPARSAATLEAPTGYYAIVEIDGSEALTDLSLDPADDEADILADPAAIGVYMVQEDELGFVYVTKAPDLRLADEWFTNCEAAYSEWLDS